MILVFLFRDMDHYEHEIIRLQGLGDEFEVQPLVREKLASEKLKLLNDIVLKPPV